MYWQDYVINRLKLSPVRIYPYQHLYITDIFPETMYWDLWRDLPPNHSFEDKSSYPGRKTQVCKSYRPDSLWNKLGDFVRGETFRDALLDKFEMSHSGRSLYYLHRDLDGFHITPHTDVQCKRLSYIFYFPQNEAHAHLGTWMLKPKDDSYPWSEDHKPWGDFEKISMAPYLPNSLFVWAVDHWSYHAVDIQFARSDPTQARHTLRGFVFKEDEPLPYTFATDFEFHGVEQGSTLLSALE